MYPPKSPSPRPSNYPSIPTESGAKTVSEALRTGMRKEMCCFTQHIYDKA